jgi:hypothetical protein
MADHDAGQPRCPGCGAPLRPGDAFCGACGTARGPERQVAIRPPVQPPPVGATTVPTQAPEVGATVPVQAPTVGMVESGQPLASGPGWGDGGAGFTTASFPPPSIATRQGAARVAQAWGVVSLVFGALVLLGSVIPWVADSTFALTDDMGSAWPLIVVGVVGVLGGIDGLRGNMQGPALAAGIGSVFVLLQVTMVRALDEVPGVEMGGGGMAWTLAAIAAVLLAIASLSVLRVDRAQGAAPSALSAAVLIAGGVWFVGMIMPATPGVSVGDHVEYVLFGGDTFADAITVLLIGIPAVLVVLAAATRSRVAHGLAAGSMVFWAVAAVTAAAGAGSGDSALRYAAGGFWPLLLGALGVAIAGFVAMVVPPPPFDPMRRGGARPVAALTPAVGLALLPIAGLVGAGQYVDDDDAYTLTAADVPFDPSGSGSGSGSGEVDLDVPSLPTDGDDGDDAGTAGSVDVVCTDLVDSSIRSAWQDVEGAIHVIILVDHGCEVGQLLDDPTASFTLTTGTADVADATFDFSSQPLFVPAYGTGDVEIVFGPDTFVDLGAVETLGLGADASTGSSRLGLVYSFTCTDAPDAPTGGPGDEAIVGDATGAPVVPQVPTASEALGRLGEIAAADGPFVESEVIDRWVPQISSKKPDVVLPNGTVWDAASILQDHRGWRERFPRVRLLWSGDYSTYELTDYWVTIVAVPFDTPEGAVGWCDSHGLPAEDCYAKLVSHSHPTADSTRNR